MYVRKFVCLNTNLGVEGTSDDLDEPIEAMFNDVNFKHRYNVGSVNSVNICRILVQTGKKIFGYISRAFSSFSFVASPAKVFFNYSTY